jgi:hypothetical protein
LNTPISAGFLAIALLAAAPAAAAPPFQDVPLRGWSWQMAVCRGGAACGATERRESAGDGLWWASRPACEASLAVARLEAVKAGLRVEAMGCAPKRSDLVGEGRRQAGFAGRGPGAEPWSLALLGAGLIAAAGVRLGRRTVAAS